MRAFHPVGLAAACTAALLVLAGCGTSRPPSPSFPPSASAPPRTTPPLTPEQAHDIAIHALGLVGTPYRYGGNTPESGFDCSGLVNYVYSDMLALRLPRSSRELAGVQGPRLAPERLAALNTDATSPLRQ